MQFAQYLKESAIRIETELQNYTKKRWNDLIAKYPSTNDLIPAFVDSCEWGKRIRAVLVKLWYQIAGGQNISDIYIPAIWVEIFQTAILAHDDIIDKSDLRRGKPTLYKVLWWDHYGVSQTICLGDIWLLLATRTMIEWNFSDEIKTRASHHFIDMIINTWIGEMIDVKLPIMSDPTYDDIISVCRLKTAEYTINTPLKLWALFAWRNDEQLSSFDEFALNLWIAFQIKDDILGIFWDSYTIGKSIDSDIVEWKRTLLRYWAQNHMNDEQKQVWESIYGHINISDADINTIRSILQDCGAYEYASNEMSKYVHNAKASISNITQDPQYINLLNELADLMMNRSK